MPDGTWELRTVKKIPLAEQDQREAEEEEEATDPGDG